ncbi:hypothetical protein BJV82DRAFT_561680 [Fennellomyces sp. T-0311]|nr:hypothetical protein BJV82DRAFT_567199 [Fennellomyces sp. T-0311]KAI8141104.1 hypothetical protein BJV82DRAFT_561680 [Fennellomyces sp. T-0311]
MGALQEYFDREYYPKKKKWSNAWRQVSNFRCGINTNNYVESWHRTLKEAYLGKLKRQRADVLVHILWDNVLPDVMADHVQARLELQAIVSNQAESTRRDIASNIEGKFNIICSLLL